MVSQLQFQQQLKDNPQQPKDNQQPLKQQPNQQVKDNQDKTGWTTPDKQGNQETDKYKQDIIPETHPQKQILMYLIPWISTEICNPEL